MSRLQKMTKYTVCSIVLCLVLFCSFSFTSNAATAYWSWSLHCAEPAKTDNNGYIVLLMRNPSNGDLTPVIYAWNTYGQDSEGSYASITENVSVGQTFVEFIPYGLNGVENAVHNIMEINYQGTYKMKLSSSSERLRIDYDYGHECVDYKIYGNGYVNYDGVGSVASWSVYFNDSEEARLLNNLYQLLLNMNSASDSSLGNISVYLTEISSKLDKLGDISNDLSLFRQNLESKINSMNINISYVRHHLEVIEGQIDDLLDKLDDMYAEEQKQTSWLEKIWNSIQEFFGSSDEEKQKGEDFKENSANQNDELGDLITDSEVEKPDIEDITDDIDTNIDLNSVSNFGEFLSCIIDNEYVSRCLLMVGVMLIMGYVLFGKRG